MANDIPISVMGYPTKMIVGPGALARLPEQMQALGTSRALIVSDAGVEKAGIVRRVEEVLAKAGFSGGVFLQIDKNPTEQNVLDGVAAYRELGADVVLAVGGGAPMDVAKVIALKTTHDRDLVDYDDAKGGDQFISSDIPPILCIPTTSGTGSEVGRAGVIVIGTGDTARKVVIFSPYLMPAAAICDAELTVGLPAPITAATGIDAMTHALEAYVAKGSHPYADMYALGALARVGTYLVRAVRDGKDLRARHEMMLAAAAGATAFQKGLGACHALAHPLGSVADIHHGLANAIMLPHVMRYNLPSVPTRYAVAGQALGLTPEGPLDAQAEASITLVEKIIRDCGVTDTLADHGVDAATIEAMVPLALEDAARPGNPRDFGADEARALYEAAL